MSPTLTQTSSIKSASLMLNTTIVKRERIRSQLTQEDVARRLAIGRAYLTHLETGTKQPSVALLRRMAKFWSIPVHDLVTSSDAEAVLAGIE